MSGVGSRQRRPLLETGDPRPAGRDPLPAARGPLWIGGGLHRLPDQLLRPVGASIVWRFVRGEPLEVMRSSPHENQAYEIGPRFEACSPPTHRRAEVEIAVRRAA